MNYETREKGASKESKFVSFGPFVVKGLLVWLAVKDGKRGLPEGGGVCDKESGGRT